MGVVPGPTGELKYQVSNPKSLSVVGAALVAVLGVQPLWAEWSVQPRLSVGAEHNSNVRLSRESEDSAIVSLIDGSIAFSNNTEQTKVSGSVGTLFRLFSGADDFTQNRDNQSASLRVRHKIDDRWAVQSRLRFRRDDLQRRIDLGQDDFGGAPIAFVDDPTSGLPDLDNETDSDLDLIGAQIRRTIGQAEVSAQYKLSERNQLRLGYRFLIREFAVDESDLEGLPAEANIVGSLNDSQRHGAQLRYSHVRSETENVGFTLDAFVLQPTDREADTDYYQAAFFWTKRFTEATTINANVGVTRAESDLGSGTGFLASLRGATRFTWGEVSASAQRSLFPTAFGEISERDRITLSYRTRFSRRLSAVLEARAERLDRVGSSLVGLDTERVNLRPQLIWNLNSRFALSLNYEYRWIDRMPFDGTEEDFGSARSHSGGVSVSWTP